MAMFSSVDINFVCCKMITERLWSVLGWLSFWIYHAISSPQVDKAIFQDGVIRFPLYTQEVMCVGEAPVAVVDRITS